MVEALEGSYNALGIRRWFARPRQALDGATPLALLEGAWLPEQPGPQRLQALAEAAQAGMVVSCGRWPLSGWASGSAIAATPSCGVVRAGAPAAGTTRGTNWCITWPALPWWPGRNGYGERKSAIRKISDGVAAALWAVVIPEAWTDAELPEVDLPVDDVLATDAGAMHRRQQAIDHHKAQGALGLRAVSAAMQDPEPIPAAAAAMERKPTTPSPSPHRCSCSGVGPSNWRAGSV